MKKVLAVLACVFLLATAIPMGIVSVSAKACTRESAVQWAYNQIGASLDYDGQYEEQCVDFIYYYYAHLGVQVMGGNASNYEWNTLPAGWQRITVVPGVTQLQAGDIAVWKPSYSYSGYTTGVNGHVGVIVNCDNVGFQAIDQLAYKNVAMRWYPLQVLSCIIRPNFESHTHLFGEWSVTMEATCGTEGQQVRSCACGVSETRTMPTTDEHFYSSLCADICGICGEQREVSHMSIYEDVETTCSYRICREQCLLCGYTKETIVYTHLADHTYTDEYDADCDVCGGVREVAERPVADAPAFVVENATAREGEEFTVAIRTLHNSGIVSLKLDLTYDAEVLELVSAQEQDFAGVTFGPVANIPFVINWCDAIHPDNTTDGVVALVTFRVKEGVEAEDTAISLTYDPEDVYDQEYNNVVFAVENGAVTIVDDTPGDLNGDGKVNNKDLGLLQQYLNGGDVTVVATAADTNGDGKVNNKDLGLLQRSLNGWDVELG